MIQLGEQGIKQRTPKTLDENPSNFAQNLKICRFTRELSAILGNPPYSIEIGRLAPRGSDALQANRETSRELSSQIVTVCCRLFGVKLLSA